MGNREINQKKQILKFINELDGSLSNLSVGELKSNLSKQIATDNHSVEETERILRSDFTDVYLKKYSDGGFGDELAIMHVKTINFKSYNTDYKKMYQPMGERISFSYMNVYRRELGFHDMFDEKGLRAFEVITRDEYQIFVNKYKKLDKLIRDIIKPNK